VTGQTGKDFIKILRKQFDNCKGKCLCEPEVDWGCSLLMCKYPLLLFLFLLLLSWNGYLKCKSVAFPAEVFKIAVQFTTKCCNVFSILIFWAQLALFSLPIGFCICWTFYKSSGTLTPHISFNNVLSLFR
jgi:hypothetical protein